MRRFGQFSFRDIVVLAAIAGLFIWYSGGRSVGGSPAGFALYIVALLAAVTFHECAHAFVALRLGDATAKMLGRVSARPPARGDTRHNGLRSFLSLRSRSRAAPSTAAFEDRAPSRA